MHRIAITILLLCAPSVGDTVISMPAPATGIPAVTPVMSMVHQAMQQSSNARVGMQALDRYAHAKQAPYNVYNVGSSSGSYGTGWMADPWYGYPRPYWGYSWGWWGWPGCIIVDIDSHPVGGGCGLSASVSL